MNLCSAVLNPIGHTLRNVTALTPEAFAIYGNHMQKTTVYLDEETYRQLKRIAHGRGRPAAEMLREAVAEYTVRYAPRRKPRSVGVFKSGRRDLGQRAEALLAGFGEDQ